MRQGLSLKELRAALGSDADLFSVVIKELDDWDLIITTEPALAEAREILVRKGAELEQEIQRLKDKQQSVVTVLDKITKLKWKPEMPNEC
jgi:DNA-binding transcriptional MerR regulator